MSEDLEGKSVPELEQRLDEQRQTCIGLLEEMAREFGTRPDASSVLFARFNALLEMMLTPEARVVFEIRAEESMETMMKLALAELRQQKLTAGIAVQGPGGSASPVGKLFVPGRG